MYTLYGAPHSLYTGKVRAYLRKQGVAFVEKMPSDPVFREMILPQIGRSIIPVLVCPDGQVVQDSVDIIEHFEQKGARLSAWPPGLRQQLAAHVLELYGSLGMTRHAMHYRWSFLPEQERFLLDAFGAGSGSDAAARVMARMASYLPPLGVTPETAPLIERSFESLLDILEGHFARHPYLLGAQPSLGDYGLLGPMFAHLGRDPVPAGVMKRRAPKVFRWVERMNAPDLDMPEYANHPSGYLPEDELPETLAPLLKHVAEELFPEVLDKLVFLQKHVARLSPADGEPVSAKPHQRTIGLVPTSFRGVSIESGVQPYLLYLWQRITDTFAAAPIEAQASAKSYFESVGLARFLEPITGVRVERRRNIEVWAMA